MNIIQHINNYLAHLDFRITDKNGFTGPAGETRQMSLNGKRLGDIYIQELTELNFKSEVARHIKFYLDWIEEIETHAQTSEHIDMCSRMKRVIRFLEV